MNYTNSEVPTAPELEKEAGMSAEAELTILQSILRDQLRMNRSLEEKNLDLNGKCVRLEAERDELEARYTLLSKSNSKGIKGTSDAKFGEDSLEADMLQAKINSTILKSIVTPLERKISFLKKKLLDAETCLSISEQKPVNTFPEVSPDTVSTDGDVNDSQSKQDTLSASSLTEIKKRLDAAELYVLSLSKQKAELTESLTVLKKSNTELNASLDEERAAHTELKETWKKANEQFLLQNISLQSEIQELKNKLNAKSEATGGKFKSTAEVTPQQAYQTRADMSSEVLALISKVSDLEEKLTNEKNNSLNVQQSVRLLCDDLAQQLSNAELENKTIDSFIESIQEEFLRVQNLLPKESDESNLD